MGSATRQLMRSEGQVPPITGRRGAERCGAATEDGRWFPDKQFTLLPLSYAHAPCSRLRTVIRDFAGRIRARLSVLNRSGNPNDDWGHGTHVAGIVGAVGNNALGIAGVTWRVKIMVCKFIDASGT
jgi:subtilisin family serine protease